jgi:hypothetical protein
MILVRDLSLKKNKVFINVNLGQNSQLTRVNPAQAAIYSIAIHVLFCNQHATALALHWHRRGAFYLGEHKAGFAVLYAGVLKQHVHNKT